MIAEHLAAIREVRRAAHELSNVCAAIVGGTQMAMSLETIDQLGDLADEVACALDAPRVAPRNIYIEDV